MSNNSNQIWRQHMWILTVFAPSWRSPDLPQSWRGTRRVYSSPRPFGQPGPTTLEPWNRMLWSKGTSLTASIPSMIILLWMLRSCRCSWACSPKRCARSARRSEHCTARRLSASRYSTSNENHKCERRCSANSTLHKLNDAQTQRRVLLF